MTASQTAAPAVWIPDASALSAFRENPERFRLAYRLGLVPAVPNDKMNAGSAIHAGLNALRMGRSVEEAVALTRAQRGEGEGARNAEHCERIVRAYAVRYPRDREPFTVVESEGYIEGVITPASGEPFTYCGIQDSVIRFEDGSEYVMDTKSTGAYLNGQWMEMMELSDQMVGYVALRRALGHRCDGFFVDGIHITDRARKDGTCPVDIEKDFARVGPVRVPEWRVERWVRDVQFTLAQIAELERTRGLDQPWPIYQNWPFGKVDAYRDFYKEPAELHGSIARLFERRVWSPREVAEGRAPA